jgi:ribosomal protein S18 acetylase RimI-like enzyme
MAIFPGETMDSGLRLAVEGDVKIIERIADDAYSHYIVRIGAKPGPMLEDYAALVRGGLVQVIERQGVVQGFLILIRQDDALLLDNVAISPEAQGQGLGRLLMAAAEKAAVALGYATIRLYTNEAMTENIGLYTRLGYRETRRVTENGLKRVYMEKPIA